MTPVKHFEFRGSGLLAIHTPQGLSRAPSAGPRGSRSLPTSLTQAADQWNTPNCKRSILASVLAELQLFLKSESADRGGSRQDLHCKLVHCHRVRTNSQLFNCIIMLQHVIRYEYEYSYTTIWLYKKYNVVQLCHTSPISVSEHFEFPKIQANCRALFSPLKVIAYIHSYSNSHLLLEPLISGELSYW